MWSACLHLSYKLDGNTSFTVKQAMMKKVEFGIDRLQLMVERTLEDEFTDCLYERKQGEIKMRDPKIGVVKVKVSTEGCEVDASVSNEGVWKVLGYSFLSFFIASFGFIFFHPFLVMMLSATLILSIAVHKILKIMKAQQKLVHFAQKVSHHLETSLNRMS